MKILHISDTHGCHRRLHNLPQADIVVHSGDCISDRQTKHYANIPEDTDILITHTPPFGILDFDDNIHYGSEELLSRITTVQPRLHLFGHIHSQHGTIVLNGTTFSNGAIMNADYSNFRMPNLVEL